MPISVAASVRLYVVPGVALVRLATRHTGRRSPVRHFALDAVVQLGDRRARREQADQLPADVPTKFVPLPRSLGIPATA